MLLPMLKEVPPFYRTSHHGDQLRSVGCVPAQPIVIGDSESNTTFRRLYRVRKRLPSQRVFYPDFSTKVPRAEKGVFDCSNAMLLQEQLDLQLALRVRREDYHRALPPSARLEVTISQYPMPDSGGLERRQRRNDIRHPTSAQKGTRENPIDLDSDYADPEVSEDPTIVRKGVVKAQGQIDLVQEEWSVATRECSVCGDSCPVSDLPFLTDCKHLPQTCSICYASWTAAQLQGSGWRETKCPESKCDVKLTHIEIQQFASPEIFQQYDTFIARTTLNEDPDFRWCRDCASGQIHHEGNIFTCASCGYKMCITHESIWHEGETCEEYDYRSSSRKETDQRAQEAASLATISKLSKKCPGPGCVYSIEKNKGCDHMTCSRCYYEFCWECLCDYDSIRRQGNSAHAEDCKYHSMRIA